MPREGKKRRERERGAVREKERYLKVLGFMPREVKKIREREG